ncbi:YwqG family protein [Lachnospiraceae bacterium 48-42]|nr:DUF1963 domain-containing protein [Dorea sp.]
MNNVPELERKTIEEIKRISARQAVNIRIDPEKKPQITDSKFGGIPYWNLAMEYPRAKDGSLLMLLAQINLDELNREGKNLGGKLPKCGMLQFFIAMDDVYGMDDYQFEDCFRKAAETVGWKLTGKKNRCNSFSEEGQNILFEELEPSGHWMLGYPCFTQYDPREGDDAKGKYSVQLFQMDSDYGKEDDYILWGDAGVANFFIREEDLAREDFRDVLYSWDCC